MRIGLVIYGSLETVSGGYLYDRKLVAYLQAAGDNVEIISLPWRNYTAHLGDNFSQGLIERLRGDFDLLLEDELNHPSLFWANRRRGEGRKTPIVSIVHHLKCSEQRPAWQNSIYRLFEKQYLESVDGFVFNSQATQESVEALVGGGRPWVKAYPAGDRAGLSVTAEEIQQRVEAGRPLRLLFVGNVIPRKGLDTLLEALGQVKAEWMLTVAGSLTVDSGYAAQIKTKVADEFSARVRLLGAVDEAVITDCYLHSDVLVVPSSYEGFGIVYLEGMGAGLPAIATTAGGASEIVTSGRDGYLMAPGDAKALAEHIEALGRDRGLLLRMSLAARERFLAEASWDESMGKIRGFLVSFANSAGRVSDPPLR
jgi:glycosyltransferase involved in cell wall biosynthesis